MAARQDHLSVLNPTFVNNQQLRLVSDKKKTTNLLELSLALKTIEDELVKAKEGSVGAPTEGAKEPGNGELSKEIEEMVYLLQMLQVKIAECQNSNANNLEKMMTADLKASQDALKHLDHKIKEMHKKKRILKDLGLGSKVSSYIIGALTMLVGVLTLQPEIVAMSVTSIAAASGGFNEAAKPIAMGLKPVLQKAGMSSQKAGEVAKLTSQVAVCTAATGATAMIGDEAQATEDAAQEGLEISDDSIELASDVSGSEDSSLDETVEESTQEKSVPSSKLTPTQRNFLKRASLALFTATQSLGSTGVVNNLLIQAVERSHLLSKKEKDAMKLALEITLAVTALLVSIGSGAAVVGLARTGSTALNMTSWASKLVSNFESFYLMGSIGEAMMSLSTSGYEMDIGFVQKTIADGEANLTILSQLVNLVGNEMSSDQNVQKQMIKNKELGLKAAESYADGMKGFAEAFSNLPV